MGRDNPVYEERILSLSPKLQALCRSFLKLATSIGFDCRVVQAYRDQAKQGELYAQGRTAPGKIVTYSKPGYSWHEYRKAFDFGLFTIGNAYIEGDTSLEEKGYYLLGPIGESLGLVWGGRWGRVDLPHFQLPGPVNPTDEDRKSIGL